MKNCNKIHLINNQGDKKVVESSTLEEEIKRLDESSHTKYTIDVDWYISHGYSTINDVRKRIENDHTERGR